MGRIVETFSSVDSDIDFLEERKRIEEQFRVPVKEDIKDAPELFFFAYLNFDQESLADTWKSYLENKDEFAAFPDDQINDKIIVAMNRCKNNQQYSFENRKILAVEAIRDLCEDAYLSGYKSFSDLEKITGIQADDMRGWFLSHMSETMLQEIYARSDAYPFGDNFDNQVKKDKVVELPVQKYQLS